MDIHKFLELLVGRWRSQRSDHQFSQGNGSDVRSLIEITSLSTDSPELDSLCQLHHFEPSQAIATLTMTWEEESLSAKKPSGSTVIVAIPDNASSPNKGIIFTSSSAGKYKGSYELGTDEALTIQTITDHEIIEERLWYGNPNLRFRVATVMDRDRQVRSSKFYSEIRIAAPKA